MSRKKHNKHRKSKVRISRARIPITHELGYIDYGIYSAYLYADTYGYDGLTFRIELEYYKSNYPSQLVYATESFDEITEKWNEFKKDKETDSIPF